MPASLPPHGELVARLREGLQAELPGHRAHVRLAPVPRDGWRPGTLAAGHRPAAGLVLLYPRGDETSLVLTVRDSGLPQHAGQVSFPGGAVEPGETIEAAALREAGEEVAATAEAIDVLGRLTPLDIPVSGFVLHPVVGAAAARPALRACDGEVREILEVPLAALSDPAHLGETTWQFRGRPLWVPYITAGEHRVWGATAMVLSELLWLAGAPVGDGLARPEGQRNP